jgi:type III secretory pathway component EscU
MRIDNTVPLPIVVARTAQVVAKELLNPRVRAKSEEKKIQTVESTAQDRLRFQQGAPCLRTARRELRQSFRSRTSSGDFMAHSVIFRDLPHLLTPV